MAKDLRQSFGPATHAAAEELRRLRDSRCGGDHRSDGFAVYFFDDDNEVIRSAGGYATIEDAVTAGWLIRAEAVQEAVARWESDNEEGP